jgi:hypothetical protein
MFDGCFEDGYAGRSVCGVRRAGRPGRAEERRQYWKRGHTNRELLRGDNMLRDLRIPQILLAVCAAAAFLAGAPEGRAQVDPVEDFFREFRAKPVPLEDEDREKYKEEWKAYIQKNLRTIPQLRRVIDQSQPVLVADSLVLPIVRQELKDRVERLAAKGDPPTQRALAVLIAEMAESGTDDRSRNTYFARTELWRPLEQLARSPDSSVRAAALRAMGLVRPRAVGEKGQKVSLVPVLEERLRRGPPAEQRLAAAALAEIMRQVNLYRARVTAQSESDVADSWQTAAAVIAAARVGLQSDDSAVRLDAARAMEQVGLFLSKTQSQFGTVVGGLNDLLGSPAFSGTLVDANPELRLISRRTLEYVAEAQTKYEALPPAPKIPPDPGLEPPGPGLESEGEAPLVLTAGREQFVAIQNGKGPEKKLRANLVEAAKKVAATLDDPDPRVRLAGIDFIEPRRSAWTPSRRWHAARTTRVRSSAGRPRGRSGRSACTGWRRSARSMRRGRRSWKMSPAAWPSSPRRRTSGTWTCAAPRPAASACWHAALSPPSSPTRKPWRLSRGRCRRSSPGRVSATANRASPACGR